jgi:hypothetical protein
MVFPQNLREAIPDMPTCSGRVLVLESFDLESTHTDVAGPRVGAILLVKETGKLTGTFEILLDLKADAARVLAQKLTKLADEAEKKTPEPFYKGPIAYKRG